MSAHILPFPLTAARPLTESTQKTVVDQNTDKAANQAPALPGPARILPFPCATARRLAETKDALLQELKADLAMALRRRDYAHATLPPEERDSRVVFGALHLNIQNLRVAIKELTGEKTAAE